MDAKHSIFGKKSKLRKKVFNGCFIVSPEPQGKKRKNTRICRSFLDTKMLNLMNNNLN